MSIHLEQEVKFRLSSWEEGLERLNAGGAELVRARHFEANQLFDFPDARLERRGEALRLRRVADEAWLTFKGPPHGSGKIKRRQETESFVGDGEALDAILVALGLVESFRYEKYRAVFVLGGSEITLDLTPIGVFLEVEGEEAAIVEAAAALGLELGEAIHLTYPRLYELHRMEVPEAPRFMVFPPEQALST